MLLFFSRIRKRAAYHSIKKKGCLKLTTWAKRGARTPQRNYKRTDYTEKDYNQRAPGAKRPAHATLTKESNLATNATDLLPVPNLEQRTLLVSFMLCD